jgi:O-antigen/teichoic acid export membrane protein
VATASEKSHRTALLMGGFTLGVIPALLIGAIGMASYDATQQCFFGRSQDRALLAGAIALLIGTSCSELLYGFYRGQHQMTRANLWQLTIFALGPAAVVYGPKRPTEAGHILVLTGLVGCMALGPILVRILGGHRDRATINRLPGALRELWWYGVPRVPGGFALQSVLTLGPLMAFYYGGMADAGSLLAGQVIFSIADVALSSFGMVMLPRVAALHAEGEIDYLRERISDVITFVGHIGLYLTLHLMVWSRVLILVWLGTAYSDAVPLLRILLGAVIPYSAFVMLSSIIDGIEHRPVNTVNVGLSLLGVGLASQVTLTYGWGMMGLALSTSLGFWLLGVLSVGYLWGRFGLVGHHLMPIKLASANAGLLLPSLGAAWLLQSHLGGMALLGCGALIEGMLSLAFCAVMYRLKARWMSEVMKRIVSVSIA